MGSSVLAPPQAVPVTLAVFGGTDTEISPSDCPEGLSPDNQDFTFLPGETSTRPCLHKRFTAPISTGQGVVYQKTYIQPTGSPLNLYLTSDGKIWVEDVVNSPAPAAPLQLGNVPAGLYMQSVSAFGREYLASSDLLHGQGVPLQYDGTFLDRVTQDAPGAPPTALDENIAEPLAASPNGLLPNSALNIATISEAGDVATLTVASFPASLRLPGTILSGDKIKIASVSTSGYNGTFSIATFSVDSVTGIATFTYINPTLGLGADTTGTITLALVIVVPSPTSTLIFGVLPPPQLITISGATNTSYNGTWSYRGSANSVPPNKFFIYMPGVLSLSASGGGTAFIAGNISVGNHQVVMMYLTRQGALTAPSPIGAWSAAGGFRVTLSNIPIGPPNVVARVFGFSGAGGDNFFTLPAAVTIPQISGPAVVIPALILTDNTSTTVTLDFSDNALFNGIAIDQIGNDLFDQVVLGPVLGFFAFASRLIAWGDWNKVENFLNMGFDGGWYSATPTVPLVWTVDTAGGALLAGGSWSSGFCWQISGDGTNNPIGRLTQPAYQDSFGDAILTPNTLYLVRFWGSASVLNLGGNVGIDFFSPSQGVLATATIPIASLSSGSFLHDRAGSFVQATFSNATPAVIPTDTVLRVFEASLPNGARVVIDELEIIFAQNPYKPLASVSYVLNPEAFAQTTDGLGPTDDSSPIQCFSLQQNNGRLHTSFATHEFQDSGAEPGDPQNGWPVNALTHSVGALSLRGCDPGQFGTGDAAEDWDIIASKNGVYINVGAQFFKVSQEMSRTIGTAPSAVTWDDINWAAQQTVWIKNNVNQRYALIGVPIGAANAPNLVFVLDYREMDTAQQISSAAPIHITLAGKMKSSDLARKWGRWNISANSAEILIGTGNSRDLFLGGPTFGNVYYLDPAKYTDDDYGQMFPYYVTYAFTDHDQEQQLGLGTERKLYKGLSAFVTGIGRVTITPLVNSMVNVYPASSPRILVSNTDAGTFEDSDLEWNTSVRGQRVFFRFDVEPLPGATDVQLKLEKFIVTMMKDPVTLTRQSAL